MLVLEYRSHTSIPIEAECLTPDHLRGKTPLEIATLPVAHGNSQVPLGDFFSVQGDAGDGQLVIEGDCQRVKWVGMGMTCGRITIRGNIGMHLGAEMAGGEIQVHGQAGDWVGAEMRGGHIHIHGDAGHLVGAAYRGSPRGIRGGVILVDGQAGNEIGTRMRRGLIALGGNTGDFTGAGLIAGSIFVFGQPGLRTGAGMKRGTVALFGGVPNLLPTFRYDCLYRPIFLSWYLRRLRSWGFNVPQRCLSGEYRRYSGDLVDLGKGEILVWERGPSEHPEKMENIQNRNN